LNQLFTEPKILKKHWETYHDFLGRLRNFAKKSSVVVDLDNKRRLLGKTKNLSSKQYKYGDELAQVYHTKRGGLRNFQNRPQLPSVRNRDQKTRRFPNWWFHASKRYHYRVSTVRVNIAETMIPKSQDQYTRNLNEIGINIM